MMRQTIYDVAKAMNLSPGTISKIIHQNGNVSNATRERVLTYIRDTGYVADTNARILKSKHSWTIGVVFADISLIGLEHPFFASIIQHFKNYVEKEGYEIVFIVNKLGQNELTYLQWCRNKKVDGVLIVSGDFNRVNIRELVDSDIPSISTDIAMPNLNSVFSDDEQGIRLGIDHARSLGFTKIACVTGPLTSRAFWTRLGAFESLMAKMEMPLMHPHFEEAESFGFNGGYQAATRLLDKSSELPE
ncbi:MAG: LacI family DNA-binding transcriptional regulator, partial [Candidatus Izemoplasmatales bacterium]|nr:LacI family DNA-binding transcriptional regulator [Candidatus Izemoplasmatales bacterium]